MTTTVAEPKTVVTPEQMLALPDDGHLYELVDGQLVEKPMSDLAHLVAENLKDELVVWARGGRGGRSFVEAPFQCFPHAPRMVRRPDVAYVSPERLAGYAWEHGYLMMVPDIAAEVVSPGEEVYDLDRKIDDYFRAGVRRVWVINPEQRTVRVLRSLDDISGLSGEAVLTDDVVLPGFRCPLATLFATPASATPPTAE